MADLATIRDGLKTRLATISGLRAHDTVPANVHHPAAVVSLDPGTFVEYDRTMGGGATYHFVIRVFACPVSESRAQDKLDAYASDTGSTSIYAAIEADDDLAGAVGSTRVVRAYNFGSVTVGGVDYLAFDLEVECLT